MSIRLAASKPVARLRLDPVEMRQMRSSCANDNPLVGGIFPVAEEGSLRSALSLFAVHGLAAARHAADQALAARESGNAEEFGRWRDICRTLDRPLARKLDNR